MANPWTLLGWTLATLALTGFITYRGVTKGIERASTIMMPVLFSLLVIMAVYNVFTDGFGQAVSYLFTVDFSKITGSVVLAAIGQAFFSIGIAMAAMMTFGAYLPRNISISQSVLIIISADTLAAPVAGLAVFPVVFSFGFDPTSGPGLIFQTYPVALARMPGHYAIGIAFFVLVMVAGLSSVLGCVEALTAWVQEHYGFSRRKSTFGVLVAVGACSVLSVLSYNVLAEWTVAGLDLTAAIDYFSNRILLPLGGLLIAVFAGWVMTRKAVLEELQPVNAAGFAVWRFAVRFVVPLAIVAILVMGIVG
jgi:NSS family neurotransmitter:Na+ symporter